MEKEFSGITSFRSRLVLAVLSKQKIVIDKIRAEDRDEPGIHAEEATFLRLLDKLTSGSRIEINETGTQVRYWPGAIVGGRISHDCGNSRSLGWFLEGVLPLLPFGSAPFVLELKGLTNDSNDRTVDLFRTVTLPQATLVGLENVEFHINSRGAPPLGGGSVRLALNPVRTLKSLSLIDTAKVKRVRGITMSTRVSPAMGNRIVDGAKAVLTHFTSDVYIYTDHAKGKESGLSPGFGVSLVAETLTGSLLGAESFVTKGGTLPEDIGNEASLCLLNEVLSGACVDSVNQSLILTLMALGPEEVSQVRLGTLTEHTKSTMRTIKELLGVTFKIELDGNTAVLSCVGSGITNTAKQMK